MVHKKNQFEVNYNKKTLVLLFKGEKFKFDLTEGDVGDFWNSFTDKKGVQRDINFYQEDETQKPSIGVYGLKPDHDGDLHINTNDSTYITKYTTVGKMEKYFGIIEEKPIIVSKKSNLQKITVPINESDIQELQNGKKFNWTFVTDKGEAIKVCVRPEVESDHE